MLKFNNSNGITFDEKNQNVIVSDYNNRVYILDKELKCLSTFGTKGKEPGNFNLPNGLCVQPATNNIIVTDEHNNRIQVFSNVDDNAKCENLYIIGNSRISRKEGEFNNPQSVVCNNRGHIIMAEIYSCRVQIFSESGKFLRLVKDAMSESENNQFNSPSDLYIDRNNYSQIMIADYYNKRISVWSSDGSQLIRNIPLNDYPKCVTIDQKGRLIVGFQSSIEIFELKCFNSIKQLLVFDINRLCITDENKLLVCVSGKTNINVINLNNF